VPARNLERNRKGRSAMAFRRRHDAGEEIGEKERALVRVGTAATKVLSGEDDLSDWDEEELRKGMRRVNKPGSRYHGKFQGKAPVVVPKALHDELVRRQMDAASKMLHENLGAAVQVLVEICNDEDTEAKDRLRAVGMILDRVMGKAPEKVEFTGEMKPWQIALQGAIVNVSPDVVDTDGYEDDDE